MALHPEPLTLVARADAGITQVEDLAGKRVWLGAEGSGTRALAGELMQALGWSADSFAPTSEIGADRLADALCDGEIDAFLYAIGHPALAIQEATTGCDARLVPLAGPAIDASSRRAPDLLAATIPAASTAATQAPYPPSASAPPSSPAPTSRTNASTPWSTRYSPTSTCSAAWSRC